MFEVETVGGGEARMFGLRPTEGRRDKKQNSHPRLLRQVSCQYGSRVMISSVSGRSLRSYLWPSDAWASSISQASDWSSSSILPQRVKPWLRSMASMRDRSSRLGARSAIACSDDNIPAASSLSDLAQRAGLGRIG